MMHLKNNRAYIHKKIDALLEKVKNGHLSKEEEQNIILQVTRYNELLNSQEPTHSYHWLKFATIFFLSISSFLVIYVLLKPETISTNKKASSYTVEIDSQPKQTQVQSSHTLDGMTTEVIKKTKQKSNRLADSIDFVRTKKNTVNTTNLQKKKEELVYHELFEELIALHTRSEEVSIRETTHTIEITVPDSSEKYQVKIYTSKEVPVEQSYFYKYTSLHKVQKKGVYYYGVYNEDNEMVYINRFIVK